MRLAAGAFLSVLGGTAALAGAAWGREPVISPGPEAVSITAYRDPSDAAWSDWDNSADGRLDERDGLVLVIETRSIDLPSGRSKVSFQGVAEGIVPQTAAIEGLGAALVERNQDYDLLNPAALIAKSVGRRVRLARTNPVDGRVTEESAIVRSGPKGTVLDFGDGRIEAVGCGAWPERLVFDEVPQGLAERPTLSMMVNAQEAGPRQVRLSYLAFGVKWQANYVVRIHPDGERLDLEGWITLSNESATSFVDAPAQVVAGDLKRDDSTAPERVARRWRTPNCWPMDTTTKVKRSPTLAPLPPPPYYGGGDVEALIVTAQHREEDIQDVPIAISHMARESELADYKLYTLPFPTTVAARQTKQVRMLDQPDVRFERLYVRELGWLQGDEEREKGGYRNPSAAYIVLRMQNEAKAGLGRALPAGDVTVVEAGAEGGLVLAGETHMRDTPVGLPVDMGVARSAYVSARAKAVDEREVETDDDTRVQRDFEVEMANDGRKTAPLELWLRLGESVRLISASGRAEQGYGHLTWSFRLAPGERKTFRYTVETEW